MDNSNINFVNYKSISQESDAFIFSDQFTPFISLEISGIYNSKKLENLKYTAGTTNNPNDFKLPQIDHVVLPNKLMRMNSFSKTYNFEFLSEDFVEEEIQEEQKQDEIIADESLEFLQFMNKIEKQESKIKPTDSFYISKYTDTTNQSLGPRSFANQVSNNNIQENTNFDFVPDKNGNNTNEIIKETNIINKQNTSRFDYNTFNNVNRTQVNNEYFTSDIYNGGDANYFDFTSQTTQQQNIKNITNEIVTNIENKINNLENKIFTENVTKQEIQNIQNNIVNVIENKINETQENILEKIESKSVKQLDQFKRNFLNS